jgi:hypothetical protein
VLRQACSKRRRKGRRAADWGIAELYREASLGKVFCVGIWAHLDTVVVSRSRSHGFGSDTSTSFCQRGSRSKTR